MKYKEIIYKEESFNIIGACMEVHNNLGSGFLEAIYQEALEHELKWRGIPFEREKELKVKYKTIVLDKRYLADFVCYDKIIVELKATKEMSDTYYAQVINYLKATGFKLAILVNFGQKDLDFRRVIL